MIRMAREGDCCRGIVGDDEDNEREDLVTEMIAIGEIHVGKSSLPNGVRWVMIDDGCRYGIVQPD